MAYIGRGTDKISNIEKLDVITFDGSQSYTLQKNSVNFVPNSANSLQVSIDGVVQAGNFTVSGSTIDFGVAIPSTSTCDFIFHYGTGLITTPADGTVTTGKIQDGAVTAAKLASGAASNTPAFEAYLSASQSSLADNANTKVQNNTEVFDTDGCYDNSTNYRFTPTTAGKYFLYCTVVFDATSTSNLRAADLRLYKNGSSYFHHSINFTENMARVSTQTINVVVDANGTTDYFEVFAELNTHNDGNWQIVGYSSPNIRTNFGGYKLIGV